MINSGTLVGAPIRVNDSLDTYPSAVDNEIQGGRHSVDTTATRDAIPAARRSPGMECYVFADGNTYTLANDLVTWSLAQGANGGSSAPGSGGTNPNVSLISGNFGAWTQLPSYASQIINDNFPLSYKADLLAFPTRAVIYIQGQFGLNGAFAGTTLLLGILPATCCPLKQIRKYFICQNIEMFLQIDTNGNVSLISKDGLNLPTTSGTPETQPYYLDLFFNPGPTAYAPTVYSYTRTANFTRNNCSIIDVGSTVSYSQTYTSTIDLATATAIGNADPNFNTAGQANANATGTCTINPTYNFFAENARSAGNVTVVITDNFGATQTISNITPGAIGQLGLNPANTYSVLVTNASGGAMTVQLDNNSPIAVSSGNTQNFAGLSTPITLIFR